ncbi:MAG: N-acetylmuramoyl-L-alanine amidase [Elusimicrobia bacterium]|nr:N-acetylmuramoyl-L-alanine amidase [Elusimicrobiota bacterium]
MKRTIASALFGLALLALPGCDEKESKKDGDGTPAVAATADAPAVSPAASRAAERLATLSDEDHSSSTLPADESLGSRSSALFDGTRASGSVLPVSAGTRESWRGAPKAQPNAAARRVSLDAGSVPSPGGLPKVDLPVPDASQVSSGAKGGGPVLLAFERKFYDTVYPVFSRRAWRASAARSGGVHQTPSRVTVHHTDGKQYMDEGEALAYVKTVQTMHMNRSDPRHGWDDIGYHFLIDGAGRVYEGRHPDLLGAHAAGANSNNVGISLMGDYNRDKPTSAEEESLRRLVTFLALKYRADPRQKGFLQPHQHYNDTDCPGKNVMAILSRLREEIDGDTQDLASRLKPRAGNSPSSFTPLLVTQPSDT